MQEAPIESFLRVPLEEYNRDMAWNQKKGQQQLIYYLDMVLKGFLSREAFERGMLDDSSWEKLQDIFKALEAKWQVQM